MECLSNNEGSVYASASDADNEVAAPAGKGRLGELEEEVVRLKRDLESLTNAFLDFKKTFE